MALSAAARPRRPRFGKSVASSADRDTAFKVVYGLVTAMVAGFAGLAWLDQDQQTSAYFLTIGTIAAWRYSWWGVHLVRALFYLQVVFPAIRREADAAGRLEKLDHVYVVVTSYRMDTGVTYRVYDALVRNALEYRVPTTIVAAVTEERDIDVLRLVLREHGDPKTVEIVTQYQKGDGKRSAMAEALRCIARRLPPPNSIVVLMDGDIRLDPGALRNTASLFIADPELEAVTTNNGALVDGGPWTREWYALRYAQRHITMASMALSSKLLVLTGRFSVFRAEKATAPGFIRIVGADSILHWRLGRIRFLSGDDKSTWFYLMRGRAKMLYVPDVMAYGYEALPDKDKFLVSTLSLLRRWFGNMLRTNGRAIRLGPYRMGFFTWWSLIDQRLSMWTSLVGPVVTVILALSVTPLYILLYLMWVVLTRTATSGITGLVSGRFSPLWPILIYYNQVMGALVKIHVGFHLDRQRWTRQNLASEQSLTKTIASHALHAATMILFVYLLFYASAQLPWPDLSLIGVVF